MAERGASKAAWLIVCRVKTEENRPFGANAYEFARHSPLLHQTKAISLNLDPLARRSVSQHPGQCLAGDIRTKASETNTGGSQLQVTKLVSRSTLLKQSHQLVSCCFLTPRAAKHFQQPPQSKTALEIWILRPLPPFPTPFMRGALESDRIGELSQTLISLNSGQSRIRAHVRWAYVRRAYVQWAYVRWAYVQRAYLTALQTPSCLPPACDWPMG